MKKTLLTSFIVIMAMTGFFACSSGGDDITDINPDLVAVPDYHGDTWVTDDDIKSEDIDLLIDLAAKIEFMRLDFIQMLSNNFEGDKLFCGAGPKTDTKPTIDCVTRMLLKEEEYMAALERLDKTNIMSPTSSTREWREYYKTGKKIYKATKEEQERVYGNMMNILDKMKIWNDDKAQQELYDFYKRTEPEYAKQIGAENARDFFKKLNVGDLNDYVFNIDMVWRVNGSSQINSVGEYENVGFTGRQEHLVTAYRLSSKVAVAAGELYLSGIDKFAGGYGSKIIEIGEVLKKKIEYIKLREKVTSGKLDLQEINKVIVNQIAEDIKGAISEALGDDKDFGAEVIEQITEDMCDYMVEQCTTESAENASGDENTVAKKKDDAGKASDKAVIDIITDFNSKANLVIITDDVTGKVMFAKPNDQGRVLVAMDTGWKTVTVINSKGERLTKRINAQEGLNTLDMQTKKASLYTNPFEISIDSKGGDEYATVVTNCKYVKQRISKQDDWWKSKIDQSGKYIRLTITADPNKDGKARSGSLVLEGYDDNSANAKAVATYTVKFTQDAEESKPQGSLKVSPTSLSFDADGGTKRIEIDTDGFEYYGGVADEDCESWISCSSSGNGVNVKVTANTTGKKREGKVYAFVTHNANAHSLDDVVYTIVPVTQAANEEKPEEKPEEKWELMGGSVSMYYAIEWKWEVSFKSTDNNVTITPKGKGANVVIQQAGKDFNAEWNSEISFDIDDLSLFESGKAKLSNYRFEMVRDGWDANFGWSHSDWSKTTTKLTSNAPKAQEASLLWYFKPEDLSYDFNQTIHYDKWKKDYYAEPIEKTEVNPKTEVTSGSFVSVGLDVKKKK